MAVSYININQNSKVEERTKPKQRHKGPQKPLRIEYDGALFGTNGKGVEVRRKKLMWSVSQVQAECKRKNKLAISTAQNMQLN